MKFFSLIAVIKNNHWYPTIGDPTFMGWFTVFAYLFTAFLCLICAIQIQQSRAKKKSSGHHHFFWWFLAIILFFLGINKQLDLQSWFTIVGKQIAHAQGWYENRRSVQLFFIAGISAIFILFLTIVSTTIKLNKYNYWLAMIGLAFLSCFVVIRAASFHHIDRLIGFQLLGFRLNWLFELGGIGAICYSAYVNLAKKD